MPKPIPTPGPHSPGREVVAGVVGGGVSSQLASELGPFLGGLAAGTIPLSALSVLTSPIVAYAILLCPAMILQWQAGKRRDEELRKHFGELQDAIEAIATDAARSTKMLDEIYHRERFVWAKLDGLEKHLIAERVRDAIRPMLLDMGLSTTVDLDSLWIVSQDTNSIVRNIRDAQRDDGCILRDVDSRITKLLGPHAHSVSSMIQEDARRLLPNAMAVRDDILSTLNGRCTRYQIPDELRSRVVDTCLAACLLSRIREHAQENPDPSQSDRLIRLGLDLIDARMPSVVSHQSMQMVATACAIGTSFDWLQHSFVGEWIDDDRYRLSLGHHWIIALSAITASEPDMKRVLDRLSREAETRSRSPRSAEHASMNLQEGIRGFLIAASIVPQLKTASPDIESRVRACLSRVQLEYYEPSQMPEAERRLRLGFMAVGFCHCRIAALSLRWTDVAKKCAALSEASRRLIDIPRVLKWVDALCSHSLELGRTTDLLPSTMLPQGVYEVEHDKGGALGDALFAAFESVIDDRVEYGSNGWRSWYAYFDTCGRISTDPGLRALSSRAPKPLPDAISS